MIDLDQRDVLTTSEWRGLSDEVRFVFELWILVHAIIFSVKWSWIRDDSLGIFSRKGNRACSTGAIASVIVNIQCIKIGDPEQN